MTLDPTFADTYDRLVAAWTQHDRLRRGGASIPELVASRSRLDSLRITTARLRHTAILG